MQIGSVTQEKDALHFIRSNGLQDKVAYIKVVIKGVTRYNCLYGNYTSYQDAETAAGGIRTTLGGVKPWVRNFGILQKLLK